MKVNFWFVCIVLLDLALLGGMISEISISYREAQGLLEQNTFASILAQNSIELFGKNDFALRFPFLLIHLCNLSLIFAIGKTYLKKPKDSLLCVAIYALLPGINITSILVSKSVLVVFFVLLLCYLHLKNYKTLFFILCTIASFLDNSFSIVFLALFFYAFKHKQNKTLLFALCAFSANMYIYSIPIGGIPKGYFLDTIGLFALLYSPLLFIYYSYTLYHRIAKKESNLMLYIGATSILFSLLLSLRQSIDLHTFLPLSVAGLPILIKDFMHDIRLRLKPFRRAYVRRFYIILLPLLLEVCILFGNKFLFLAPAKKHFLEDFYFAKELAAKLHQQNISSLSAPHRLQIQLGFYGISYSPSPKLTPNPQGEIHIRYLDKTIKRYHLN